ncbi:MAG: hypothetical protein HZC29_01200 [Thaumarchaeota archaeon]|nr:hypothetical protein [Nitrososphaerota archaeon]
MPETVSYFDITEFYWTPDTAKSGAIIQSGANAWKPLVDGFDRILMKHREERYQSRGNLQTLSIDQQVKKWIEWEYNMTALKYDSASPALGYWDFIAQAFYGGATGAPAIRPGAAQLGVKINRSTPEFYTISDAVISSVQFKGSFVKDALMLLYKGMGRLYRLDTNNFVQGTATKRASPPKIPIVPSNECRRSFRHHVTDSS